MITFQNVRFSYSRKESVLDAVHCEFQPGLTMILGPNGAGKSTLLKLAAGVERPDSGWITINGHDLWKEEVAARRALAYLPEYPDVTPYATLTDILSLVCRIRGRPWRDGRRALDALGLARKANRTIRELSSGERKRTLLAAAMIGTGTHLLLDEPLDSLDRDMKDTIIDWMTDRARAGAAVAVVSHTLEPFLDQADRAIVIRNGRVGATKRLAVEPRARLQQLEEMARGRVNPDG